MTAQQILQSDLLDILFEGRNKHYGAYLLRRGYNRQLVKAIGITTLLVIALLFFGGTSKQEAIVVDDNNGLIMTDVALPKPQELPKPKVPEPPAQQPPVKQEILLEKMRIVELAKDPIATQRSLDDALPGAARVDAPPSIGVPPAEPPTTPSVGGTGSVTQPEKAEPPLPSRQPQFPGGAAAWLRFLERNLTPPEDLEPGERRSVLMRFSVDEEGVVTNFQVVQSGGAAFDAEVIRALRKMPRWLPAIQAGKPAAVSFTQPVTFQGPE